MCGDVGAGRPDEFADDESAATEWARGSVANGVPPPGVMAFDPLVAVASRLGGRGGGGEESLGGRVGASGACLTLGDTSPNEDSRFRRGGSGGGNGDSGLVGAG